MSEKLKKQIIFVLTDTVGIMVMLSAIALSLIVFFSFLAWSFLPFEVLWEIKWLLLRILLGMSFGLALMGGIMSNFRD